MNIMKKFYLLNDIYIYAYINKYMLSNINYLIILKYICYD